MDTPIRFIGFSGSLRKGSFNTMLLNSCMELLPENVSMEIASIDLPLYNQDLDEPTKPRPELVQKLRDAMAKADGIVIVSPEYNYNIPGGLKNMIDWVSRGQDSPILNKPVAVMGATTGLWGTIRMQLAFLPVFQFLKMKPVLQPEVLIAQANKKFDEHGHFTDEMGRDIVKKKLQALKDIIVNEKR